MQNVANQTRDRQGRFASEMKPVGVSPFAKFNAERQEGYETGRQHGSLARLGAELKLRTSAEIHAMREPSRLDASLGWQEGYREGFDESFNQIAATTGDQYVD